MKSMCLKRSQVYLIGKFLLLMITSDFDFVPKFLISTL